MSDNCGLKDGELHMHSERCYQAGVREGRRLAEALVQERNLAVLKHELVTPMRGHDEDGTCCRRAQMGDEK